MNRNPNKQTNKTKRKIWNKTKIYSNKIKKKRVISKENNIFNKTRNITKKYKRGGSHCSLPWNNSTIIAKALSLAPRLSEFIDKNQDFITYVQNNPQSRQHLIEYIIFMFNNELVYKPDMQILNEHNYQHFISFYVNKFPQALEHTRILDTILSEHPSFKKNMDIIILFGVNQIKDPLVHYVSLYPQIMKEDPEVLTQYINSYLDEYFTKKEFEVKDVIIKHIQYNYLYNRLPPTEQNKVLDYLITELRKDIVSLNSPLEIDKMINTLINRKMI